MAISRPETRQVHETALLKTLIDLNGITDPVFPQTISGLRDAGADKLDGVSDKRYFRWLTGLFIIARKFQDPAYVYQHVPVPSQNLAILIENVAKTIDNSSPPYNPDLQYLSGWAGDVSLPIIRSCILYCAATYCNRTTGRTLTEQDALAELAGRCSEDYWSVLSALLQPGALPPPGPKYPIIPGALSGAYDDYELYQPQENVDGLDFGYSINDEQLIWGGPWVAQVAANVLLLGASDFAAPADGTSVELLAEGRFWANVWRSGDITEIPINPPFPIIPGGLSGAYEDFETYPPQISVPGLNGGRAINDLSLVWGGPWVGAAFIKDTSLGVMTFDGVAPGTQLDGAAGGYGWGGNWLSL